MQDKFVSCTQMGLRTRGTPQHYVGKGIPHIKNEITNQINIHPHHIYTLCGDFNRDIALRGRQNDNINTPHKKTTTNGKISP
jgi:hypothetical protein